MEIIGNVEVPESLSAPKEEDAPLDPPLKPFRFQRAFPSKDSARPSARPPLNANWVSEAVNLAWVADREA